MESDNGVKLSSLQSLDNDAAVKYTIPGILHFIQHEWARFEMERAHWDVERAELQARIAFLQGERKGQENLKHDLIRRIKMLEFALKQERAKYHRLRYGTDINQDKNGKEDESGQAEHMNDSTTNSSKPGVGWRQGRQLLRQYLQELGYTDSLLDVRSSRVRSILSLSAVEPAEPALVNGTAEQGRHGKCAPAGEAVPTGNTDLSLQVKQAKSEAEQNRITSGARSPQQEGTEADVMANFDFLQNDDEEEENDDDLDDGGSADDESDEREDEQDGRRKRAKQELSKDEVDEMLAGDVEAADALAEFDFVIGEESEGSESDVTVVEVNDDSRDAVEDDINIRASTEGKPEIPADDVNMPDAENKDDWGVDPNLLAKLKEQYKKERKGKKNQKRPARSALQAMLANLGGDEEMPATPSPSPSPAGAPVINPPAPVRLMGSRAIAEVVPPIVNVSLPPGAKGPTSPTTDEPFESALGLGELASLTVSNEAEPLTYDVTPKEESFRKTWNPKFTLRSHFDSIRSICFHPTETAVISASEDHTLKLWNLQKTLPQRKSTTLDVEPIFTFRGHSGPVLSCVINSTSEMCFSAGTDTSILCWNIPPLDYDPYGPYNPELINSMLVAHTDAVWDLAVQTGSLQLLSCSADGTCRLWSPTLKSPLLNTYQADKESGAVPTSIDFRRTEASQMVASYSNSQCIIYDLETAAPVVHLDSAKTYNNSPSTQINKVVTHPTLPVTITAHEDRHIKFFDNNSGKQIHSMVAHLDAVTCLSVDPNGLYLLSGSHDCSIRLWNLDTKTCVQEITSHRKKFDEAIYDVAFHPVKPFIASAGADGLAKVFV